MNSVVALRARPAPRFDAMAICGFAHVLPGFFVAMGEGGRCLHGRLGIDAVPAWATRIHLNDAAYARLMATVKADEG